MTDESSSSLLLLSFGTGTGALCRQSVARLERVVS